MKFKNYASLKNFVFVKDLFHAKTRIKNLGFNAISFARNAKISRMVQKL